MYYIDKYLWDLREQEVILKSTRQDAIQDELYEFKHLMSRFVTTGIYSVSNTMKNIRDLLFDTH